MLPMGALPAHKRLHSTLLIMYLRKHRLAISMSLEDCRWLSLGGMGMLHALSCREPSWGAVSFLLNSLVMSPAAAGTWKQ